MIYKSKKSKKWKGSLLLTPIALMHTPHLDSHKHPRPDGGVMYIQYEHSPISMAIFKERNHMPPKLRMSQK